MPINSNCMLHIKRKDRNKNKHKITKHGHENDKIKDATKINRQNINSAICGTVWETMSKSQKWKRLITRYFGMNWGRRRSELNIGTVLDADLNYEYFTVYTTQSWITSGRWGVRDILWGGRGRNRASYYSRVSSLREEILQVRSSSVKYYIILAHVTCDTSLIFGAEDNNIINEIVSITFSSLTKRTITKINLVKYSFVNVLSTFQMHDSTSPFKHFI